MRLGCLSAWSRWLSKALGFGEKWRNRSSLSNAGSVPEQELLRALEEAQRAVKRQALVAEVSGLLSVAFNRESGY
jgi:hypothetical protein